MTVKEMRELLFEFPDDLEILFEAYSFNNINLYKQYAYVDGKVKIVEEYVELV